MTSYAFPWFSAAGFNAKQNVPALIILLCLVTFLSIYGPAMVEASLRQCFANWIIKNIQRDSQSKKNLIAIESVHITGLLEKFIWSLTDFVKLSFSLIFPVLILVSDSLVSFICGLLLSFCIFYAVYASRFIAFRIRKNIAKSNRILVKCFDKYLTDIGFKKDYVSFRKSISCVCCAQQQMIIWRSVVSFIATSMGIILIITGLLLVAKGITMGTFMVFSGSIVMQKIHKFVDAFIVLQGETIHFDEVKRVCLK